MLKLGFDLDQVVVDCLDSIKKAVHETFGVRTTDNLYASYYLDGISYTDDEETNKAIGKFLISELRTPEFYMDMMPIKDAVSSLQYLSMTGNEIYFVTSRREEVESATLKWLDRNGVSFDGVYHTKHKGGTVKALKLDFFIDDHIQHLDDILNSGYMPKKGLCLFDRVWNRAYNKMLYAKVYNWQELVDMIENTGGDLYAEQS